MMREAQRMMQDPQFQLQMQNMMKQQKMQNAIQATKQTISDPHKLKQLELKTKLALADGEKKLAELEKVQQKKNKPQQHSVETGMKSDDVNDQTSHSETDDKNRNDPPNDSNDTTIANTTEHLDDDIPDLPALSLN
jgi:hypothetical protein